MKAGILGMCAAGAGGCYLLAGTPGPDFERVIDRPPMTVYAAFSALGRRATMSGGPAERLDSAASPAASTRNAGEAIHYEILVDDRPVLDVELNFAPGPDGRARRMTAEFDIDAYALGSAYETTAGIALSMVPEGYIDQQFAQFMDDMADDVEAGRPLPPLVARPRRHAPRARRRRPAFTSAATTPSATAARPPRR